MASDYKAPKRIITLKDVEEVIWLNSGFDTYLTLKNSTDVYLFRRDQNTGAIKLGFRSEMLKAMRDDRYASTPPSGLKRTEDDLGNCHIIHEKLKYGISLPASSWDILKVEKGQVSADDLESAEREYEKASIVIAEERSQESREKAGWGSW